MIVLKTNNLKKYYGKGANQVRALDGISIAIEKGQFTAIVGSSGSGKTTLLNMLGGLDWPTEGNVEIEGIDMAGLNKEEICVFRRRKIGFVFQSYNLIPTLNVFENILFSLDLDHAIPDMAFIEEIIHLLHLSERLEDYPSVLSGGQQQRVAIARALAAKPAILLADEPTGNLDSKTSQEVIGLLRMCADNFHQTLVVITHNHDIALLADQILQIEDGQLKT